MSVRSSSFNSGTSSTPSVVVPAGATTNDIVLLAATIDHPSAVFDAGDWPSGFAELNEVSLTLDGQRAAVGWKRLSGADAGPYTFGDLGQSGDWTCIAVCFAGRHLTDPPVAATAATDNNANASPVAITSNGVTAVSGDDLAWISVPDVDTTGAGAGHSPPSGYVSQRDVGSGFSNLCVATKESVGAGATGGVSGTFALTSGASGWAAFLIRIPSAPVTAPVGYQSVEEWARDPSAKRLYLFEITDALSLEPVVDDAATIAESPILDFAILEGTAAIPTSALQTLRFGTEDFVTSASDSPARTPYLGLIEAARVEFGADGLPYGGRANVFAEVELTNGDGALDQFLESFAVEGRQAKILVGHPDWLVSGIAPALGFAVLFIGTVVATTISTRTLRFRLDSKARLLDVPLQRNYYEATTTPNQALVGLPKPLLYGQVYNVSPPMIDSTRLTYQVHDGAITNVSAVYDRGIPLIQVADATEIGEYTVDLTKGTFRLGAQPDGTITCDAKRVTGFSDPWWGIVKPSIENNTELTVDTTDLVGFVGAFRGDSGAWFGTEATSIADAVDEVTRGAGIFWWAVGSSIRLRHPWISEGTPLFEFDETEVYDVERAEAPTDVAPAVSRVEVSYRRVYTVQSDLAADVEVSRVAELALERRVSAIDDSGVASRYPSAKTLHYDSAYNLADGALRIAAANKDVWGRNPAHLVMRTSFLGALAGLGERITVDLPRFAMSSTILLVTRVAIDTRQWDAVTVEGMVLSPDFYNWTNLSLQLT